MTHHPNLQDFNNKREAEAARRREARNGIKHPAWTAEQFQIHMGRKTAGLFERILIWLGVR